MTSIEANHPAPTDQASRLRDLAEVLTEGQEVMQPVLEAHREATRLLTLTLAFEKLENALPGNAFFCIHPTIGRTSFKKVFIDYSVDVQVDPENASQKKIHVHEMGSRLAPLVEMVIAQVKAQLEMRNQTPTDRTDIQRLSEEMDIAEVLLGTPVEPQSELAVA